MTTTTVMKPDEAALRGDLRSVDFRVGVAEGRWDLADPPGVVWPYAVFWVAAPLRPNSPDRFHLRLDCAGYPAVGPTGRFWDHTSAGPLPLGDYPKGTGDTAKVFRTDWPPQKAETGDTPGSALYHPFDRRPASDHPDWKTKHPELMWTSEHTVVDYLEMVYGLLNTPTYTGIR